VQRRGRFSCPGRSPFPLTCSRWPVIEAIAHRHELVEKCAEVTGVPGKHSLLGWEVTGVPGKHNLLGWEVTGPSHCCRLSDQQWFFNKLLGAVGEQPMLMDTLNLRATATREMF
jgi:hypothetical protein